MINRYSSNNHLPKRNGSQSVFASLRSTPENRNVSSAPTTNRYPRAPHFADRSQSGVSHTSTGYSRPAGAPQSGFRSSSSTGPRTPSRYPNGGNRNFQRPNSRPTANYPHHSRPQNESASASHSHTSDSLSSFKDPTAMFIGTDTENVRAKKEDVIPPLAAGNIRVIPLGGVEEIGKNMTAIEMGNDIIVVDIGFQFKEEGTPGVDYILPNTRYLEDNKSKIRAVFITHGHLDHVGGVPYVMPRIGNPTIYTRELTSLMLKKRQEEFSHLPPLDIKVVDKEDIIRIGGFVVSFFSVTHTIPDSMGLIIRTPYGNIVYTGDLKVDHEKGIPLDSEELEFSKFAKEKTLLLLAESTNIENPGFTLPEREVHENLEKIIINSQGRLIIGTFSSLLERIIKIIEIAERHGKKIVIEGRSMKNNVEIVKQMGLLKTKPGTIVSVDDIDNYPPDRVIVLATGAQGDEFAALMRMSTKTHKYIKLNKRDTVVLSSSVVPGNEIAVQKLKDNISRHGTKIIHYKMEAVHSSGHANRDEIIWVHKKVQPKFFIPIHGHHHSLRVHADIAMNLGMPEKNIIIPDNGNVIEIQDGGEKIVKLKEKAPSGLVLVDGFSIGDVQEVVIRDRQMLAQDGMFVIIASINPTNGKLRKSPDIISRGFVYLRESQELLHDTRQIIKKTIEDSTHGMNPINFDYVKGSITDN
ncbi:MAG: ribonuclease J, partial [bacterium]